MSVLKYLRVRNRPTGDGPFPHGDSTDIVNRGGFLSTRTNKGTETGLLAAAGTPVSSVARVLTLTNSGVGIDGEVFAIGDYFYELNASDGVTPSNQGASPANAQGTITFSGTPTVSQTVTVNDQTYTFIGPGSTVGNQIAMATGASYANVVADLVTAINGTHATATAATGVSAFANTPTTIQVTADSAGVTANSYPLSDTSSVIAVDGGGYIGGSIAGSDPEYFPIDITAYADKAQGTLTLTAAATADDTMTVGTKVYTFKALPANDGEIPVLANALDQAVAIYNAVNGNDGYSTANTAATAAGGGGGDVIFTAITGGVASDAIVTTETFTAAGNVFDATTLGATTAGVDAIAAEIVDAAVASLTALNVSGVSPFTIADAGNNATITSDLNGVAPNSYVLYETFANATLTQATAGVAGTAGQAGSQMYDGSNLYTLYTSDEVDEAYVWYEVAHAAV